MKMFLLNFFFFCKSSIFCSLYASFGHTAISVTVRVAFAFYLVIFLFPFIGDVKYISESSFIVSLLSEITLGLVAAMLVNIIFSSVKIIGEFVEYSTALSMAMMFDPTTGSQEGLVAKLLFGYH